MWTWRLAVRWPVRQVVLFNMSVSWSNLRVWCCFSFSLSMHTDICVQYGQADKVVSRCLLIYSMQRNVSPSCTTASSFWCLLAKKNKVVASSWFRWQAPTSATILGLCMLWYGVSALVAWVASDELILAVLRLEWKGFCGHQALRSLIWIRAQPSLDSWAVEWTLCLCLCPSESTLRCFCQ